MAPEPALASPLTKATYLSVPRCGKVALATVVVEFAAWQAQRLAPRSDRRQGELFCAEPRSEFGQVVA